LIKYNNSQRIRRVKGYRDFASRYEKDLGRTGKIVHAEGIDFSRKF
jgi:hypothetical protein